jgi:putative FmdB family regulatory protein
LPIYEYRCRKCGELIEKIQKFSDPPLSVHPACGGELELVLSPPAIQFKGSGFYITDYARKPSGSAGESAGKSESASKSGDAGSKGSEGGSKSTETSKAPAASKKD